MRAKTKATLY